MIVSRCGTLFVLCARHLCGLQHVMQGALQHEFTGQQPMALASTHQPCYYQTDLSQSRCDVHPVGVHPATSSQVYLTPDDNSYRPACWHGHHWSL